MSNVFFSEDVVELGSETGQAFQQLIADSVAETAKPNISDFFPFLSALDLSRRPRPAGPGPPAGYAVLRQRHRPAAEQRRREARRPARLAPGAPRQVAARTPTDPSSHDGISHSLTQI
uniref:Uncharacterized protein n=1 Tax=Oryza brachyantha TaxID=4533 RepID=J3KYI5_ORYBR